MTIKGVERQLETSTENESTFPLWCHFKHLSDIPRPSGEEKAVGDYIQDLGQEMGFECERDKIGNLLIRLTATPGFAANPGVILQGHLDMVCESAADAPIDPKKQGIILLKDEIGKWLTADKTSLGADNGIGLAAMLSLMKENIPHGPLALLFTVDEERGLAGAKELNFDLRNYQYLINLDSEDVREMTIGCAGAEDTVIELPVDFELAEEGMIFARLKIANLRGGHSGEVIKDVGDKKANGIKFLTNLLSLTQEESGYRLVAINGGTARNIIPKQVEAVLAVKAYEFSFAREVLTEAFNIIREQYFQENEAEFSFEETDSSDKTVFTPESQDEVIKLLQKLPNGVYQMSQVIGGLVDTSTNLAMVETLPGEIKIRLMTRSASQERRRQLQEEIEEAATGLGAVFVHENGYPGWEPAPKNRLVRLVQETSKELTGKILKITAIHGGLECGLIGAKYPHLQMVSLGPTIKEPHTIRERVNIDSVEKFYGLLKAVLTKLK